MNFQFAKRISNFRKYYFLRYCSLNKQTLAHCFHEKCFQRVFVKLKCSVKCFLGPFLIVFLIKNMENTLFIFSLYSIFEKTFSIDFREISPLRTTSNAKLQHIFYITYGIITYNIIY